MHSPMMKWLGMATWLVTALASINVLSGAYNYNALLSIGNSMPMLIVPIIWIIGISGMISLAMFVKGIMMGGVCGCSCSTCSCNK